MKEQAEKQRRIRSSRLFLPLLANLAVSFVRRAAFLAEEHEELERIAKRLKSSAVNKFESNVQEQSFDSCPRDSNE